MDYVAFEKDTLSERVADYIRRHILYMDTFRDGDHILETDIAEKLDVSRATVREALKDLETQGIVEIIPRKGTYVAAFDHKDMIEILELRCMCEAYIFETVVNGNMLDARDFSILESIIDEMVQVSRSTEESELAKSTAFTTKDLEFHGYIWKKSGRRWFCKVLSDNYYRLRLAMMQDMILERDMEKSATMHYDILNALREKDLDAARNYLRRHILSLYGSETVI
ncbi:GntR family transcriptional regulator [Aminivibrio sp.]|jgi:DNA-binding GntR family transcriptional regulator|uniref:GntR family transcriptional regulator n=1 Tax=Aminivibrio sp. TaxID=1872489 RepID=UPI001A42DF14|nr:GntR family transcriptional regulator [Aminivibrio sp.]MBL3538655.1 GntR family transcriptional regulator [Aminivibrio sp.]MDK2959193.1 hypothetical protein [Synergistaceae bacterium]